MENGKITPESRKSIARGIVGVFLLLVFVDYLLINYFDLRVYHPEVESVLEKSIQLIDTGEFTWAGNPIFGRYSPKGNYTIGPLTHLLTAIPLAIWRNVFGVYYFQCLFSFLSILFFSRVLKEVSLSSPEAFAAGMLSFGSAVLVHDRLILPYSVGFLPFFVALYFLFLAKCNNSKSWAVLPLWISFGLCLQLHFYAIVLFLPTMIVVGKRRLAWKKSQTVLGIIVVLVMHQELFYQLFFKPFPALFSISSPGTFLFAYIGFFVESTIRFFFQFGYANWVVAIFIFLSFKWRNERIWKNDLLIQGGLLALGASMLLIPVAAVVKRATDPYYFNFFEAYLAFFVAELFQFLFRPKRSEFFRRSAPWAFRLFVLLAFLSLLSPLRGIETTHDKTANFRLRQQVKFAEICAEHLASMRPRHLTFYSITAAPEEGEDGYHFLSDKSPELLIRIAHPQLRFRLGEWDRHIDMKNGVLLFLFPKGADLQAPHEILPANARLVQTVYGDIQTGQVYIFQQ